MILSRKHCRQGENFLQSSQIVLANHPTTKKPHPSLSKCALSEALRNFRCAPGSGACISMHRHGPCDIENECVQRSRRRSDR